MQNELYWLREAADLNIMLDEELEQFIESRGGEDFLSGAVKECVSQIVDVVVVSNELQPSFAELVEGLNISKYHITKLRKELEAIGYDDCRDKEEWICDICSRNELEIERRLCSDILYPQYHKNWGKAKMCCFSCYMWENHKDSGAYTCSQCGVYELMEGDDGDSLEGTFIRCGETGILCSQCHDEINGFCSLSEISTDDEDVYEDEYENEDLPENNEEKAVKIKNLVKEAGEIVYEIQEKISEGEYLKLMDLLQKITNETNSL